MNIDVHWLHHRWYKYEHNGELHKSEVLLIASTLFVVKAEKIYQNNIKMHKMMKIELSH